MSLKRIALSIFILAAIGPVRVAYAGPDPIAEDSKLLADALTRSKVALGSMAATVSQASANARIQTRTLLTSYNSRNRSAASQLKSLIKEYRAASSQITSSNFYALLIPSIQEYIGGWDSAVLVPLTTVASVFGGTQARVSVLAVQDITSVSNDLINANFRAALLNSADSLHSIAELDDASGALVAIQRALTDLDAQMEIFSALSRAGEQFLTQRLNPLLATLTDSRSDNSARIAAAIQNTATELTALQAQVQFFQNETQNLRSLALGAQLDGRQELANEYTAQADAMQRQLTLQVALLHLESAASDILSTLLRTSNNAGFQVPFVAAIGAILRDGLATEVRLFGRLSLPLPVLRDLLASAARETNSQFLLAAVGAIEGALRQVVSVALTTLRGESRQLETSRLNIERQYRLSVNFGSLAVANARRALASDVQELERTRTRLIGDSAALSGTFQQIEARLRNALGAGASATGLTALTKRIDDLNGFAASYAAALSRQNWSLILQALFSQLTRNAQLTTVERERLLTNLTPIIQSATARGKLLSVKVAGNDILALCESSACRRAVRAKIIPVIRSRRSLLLSLNKSVESAIAVALGMSPTQFTQTLGARLAEVQRLAR